MKTALRVAPSRPILDKTPPPSRADKMRRALWGMTWLLLYRPSPTPFHGWRRFLLRLFGARVGAAAHPYPAAWIWAPWNLEMGARSCLANGVDCYSVARVSLGAGAIVSHRAYLCSASYDFNDAGFSLMSGAIRIGDGAWIAAEAFVGPGVSVGDYGVAGARAVVVRDVAAGDVVGGNPARIIGKRVLDR